MCFSLQKYLPQLLRSLSATYSICLQLALPQQLVLKNRVQEARHICYRLEPGTRSGSPLFLLANDHHTPLSPQDESHSLCVYLCSQASIHDTIIMKRFIFLNQCIYCAPKIFVDPVHCHDPRMHQSSSQGPMSSSQRSHGS